jgi:hypothetical protein
MCPLLARPLSAFVYQRIIDEMGQARKLNNIRTKYFFRYKIGLGGKSKPAEKAC